MFLYPEVVANGAYKQQLNGFESFSLLSGRISVLGIILEYVITTLCILP